ncbi:aminotransferase, DegT/DnrJ/EryC1/StrS family [Campylobacter blaseri]|uniref:Aminotransferase DegT n=1 Tax=Campylobacter blaseri TaxID=2042961 RepID=A0A2P8R250_9BACT|nr:DegT/DnrJ/EryC1/StrS aminotransferase family protein [Campylobacter blaseri]PSM52575.1 aminotransferase DegT [Campylobacter blaseri]PSM54223.1 aminotransferase DegT [Campylobacter blaseri]QKF85874.1 aminotransferase, DegT/DnrJ/EryC1/StrS family [Campylobacter blaseri]
MKKIPFFRASIDNKEEELILKVLFNQNSNIIETFETDIKKYFNSKYAVLTNNGTSALHLALCAMGIKRADKIICSVNSFPDIPEVIRHFDAEPIPVDIDENTLNIDINKFEETLIKNKHKKLKAAFINHVAGYSSKMDEIYALAKQYNIKIIDDASRAIGTTYKGKLIGSIKDSFVSCFRINPQFQNSVAVAGFFTTNDEEVNEQAKIIRSNGIINHFNVNQNALNYMYDVFEIGQKYDIGAISAAFAKAQFEKIDIFTKRRRDIAKMYHERLKECPHIFLPKLNDEGIYTQFIIKIDKNRDNFARQLMEFGINTALHYIPIHFLTYYKQKYGFKVNEFPGALKTYQQILSLPIYADLKDEEVEYICEKISFIANNSV